MRSFRYRRIRPRCTGGWILTRSETDQRTHPCGGSSATRLVLASPGSGRQGAIKWRSFRSTPDSSKAIRCAAFGLVRRFVTRENLREYVPNKEANLQRRWQRRGVWHTGTRLIVNRAGTSPPLRLVKVTRSRRWFRSTSTLIDFPGTRAEFWKDDGARSPNFRPTDLAISHEYCETLLTRAQCFRSRFRRGRNPGTSARSRNEYRRLVSIGTPDTG